MTGHRFDQAGYWIKRHQELKNDPRSVGNLGSTRDESFRGEVDYKSAISSVAEELAKQYSSVLDLGCGYGRIASEFIAHGFDYTGIDISPEAIARARTSVPQGSFFEGNLVEWKTTQKFDVVCVLYVFVHFTEDHEWAAVLEAALSRIRPGGMLFFADYFPAERTAPVPHVVNRPLSDYVTMFARHGFELDASLARFASEITVGNGLGKQFRFARR